MTSLYAEYLPNIRTLTITTVLNTPRDHTTALWLTADRTKIVLQHADETHRISLPAKVSGQGSQNLQLPNTGELQCVNRIPAEAIFCNEEVVVPWSASALDAGTELRCKQCETLIMPGKVQVWKDLPSEAWAEMMDLWHCHKPAEPEHTHDDAPAKKGYAAGNRLVAQIGTGFVDVMSFLLAPEDCNNVETQASTNDEIPQLHCKTCASPLGTQDPQTQGLRLQKPHLAISSHSTTAQAFAPVQWFSSYLTSTIESQGVRKFNFATLPHELWVFSTDIAFASLDSPTPKQGIKVLFRKREGDRDVETMRAANLLIETLTLGQGLEGLLMQCLRERNSLLPQNLRSFVGWEVAVLPLLQGRGPKVE